LCRNADIKSKEYNLYLQYPGLVIKPLSFILFGTIIRQMFFFVIVKESIRIKGFAVVFNKIIYEKKYSLACSAGEF